MYILQTDIYTLKVTKGEGGPVDPTSLFRNFYYFRAQFFHRYFLLLLHFVIALIWAKKSQLSRRFPTNEHKLAYCGMR